MGRDEGARDLPRNTEEREGGADGVLLGVRRWLDGGGGVIWIAAVLRNEQVHTVSCFEVCLR